MRIIIIIFLFLSWANTFADNVGVNRDPFAKPELAATALNANQDGTLSLDFSSISVREVLRLLAEFARINMVMSDAVSGNVTLHLQRVTWQQALDTILILEGLSKQQQNNVIFIARANEIEANTSSTLTSMIIPVHYAKAADLVTLLKSQDSSLWSKQGVIAADIRTNSLWIQETPQKIAAIRALLARLDQPVKQVLIQARIVNIDENYLQELGVKFGTVSGGNASVLDGLNMDLPVSVKSNGHFNIAIAKLGGNTLLDLELSALESEGHGKIISSPELVTADRMPAYIESGEEVPYQEKTSSGATNVTFKKAVLSLKVVPQITPEGHIFLDLTVNQDKLSPVTVNGVPAIQTREVRTQVLVNNGQTLVLGGIYEQTQSDNVERIPFLSAIPGVGKLFTNKVTRTERKELLIFVTPKIMAASF